MPDQQNKEDITELSQSGWKAIANAGQGIVVYDPDLRFLDDSEKAPIGMVMANAAFCRMIGHTEQEPSSRTFESITQLQFIGKYITHANELRCGKPSLYRTETCYVRKNGEIVCGAFMVTALRGTNGDFLNFLVMVQNVMEHKQAEELLMESEIRYRRAPAIAGEMNLSKVMTKTIKMAGLIHDLGKLPVPAEILTKPTKPTDHEMGLIRRHPQTGYDILKEAQLPYPIVEVVLQHHEKLNGTGYPQGLKEDDIFQRPEFSP